MSVLVAFDADNCLCTMSSGFPVPNEDVRTLLILLSGFPDVQIHLWSNAGAEHAEHCAYACGVAGYIDSYSAKRPGIDPVITIDDEVTDLGAVNLLRAGDGDTGDDDEGTYDAGDNTGVDMIPDEENA